MNCECAYVLQKEEQTIENYWDLAKEISEIDGYFEPVALSVMNRSIVGHDDYDNRHERIVEGMKVLYRGDIVLFAQGKYHHMYEIEGVTPLFFGERPDYTDFYEFNGEENFTEIPEIEIPNVADADNGECIDQSDEEFRICECAYFLPKEKQTIKNYFRMAEVILEGDGCLEPVSLSVMNNKGNVFLLAQGAYCDMFEVGKELGAVVKPIFFEERPDYTDFYEFNGEENFTEIPEIEIPKIANDDTGFFYTDGRKVIIEADIMEQLIFADEFGSEESFSCALYSFDFEDELTKHIINNERFIKAVGKSCAENCEFRMWLDDDDPIGFTMQVEGSSFLVGYSPNPLSSIDNISSLDELRITASPLWVNDRIVSVYTLEEAYGTVTDLKTLDHVGKDFPVLDSMEEIVQEILLENPFIYKGRVR